MCNTLERVLCLHTKIVYGALEEVNKPDMGNIKIKWLIYTVLVGLIPVLLRVLIWSILQKRTIDLFNSSDFVAFGLVLHISNINQIEHFNNLEKSWKTIQNGLSIVFIVLYGALFTCALFEQSTPGLIKTGVMKYAAMVLSLASFGISFAVYDRISKLELSSINSE